MSNKFSIAETETFQRSIASPDLKRIYLKIKSGIYPQLRVNPFFGRNIKKLKGELRGLYRYRIGDYRLFYKIDAGMILVFILDIKPRKDSY